MTSICGDDDSLVAKLAHDTQLLNTLGKLYSDGSGVSP
jgi:hypothetical protein